MKHVYWLTSYKVFCAIKDRNEHSTVSQDVCREIVERLKDGGTALSHGLKFKPEKNGKFRVYKL